MSRARLRRLDALVLDAGPRQAAFFTVMAMVCATLLAVLGHLWLSLAAFGIALIAFGLSRLVQKRRSSKRPT
ncbi:MAG: hypothetical protein JWP14_2065 [Frankiales bacterium]|nr:hypothetical protein [Frankiales bacterium]